MSNNHLMEGIEEELKKYNFTDEKFEQLYQYTLLVPSLTNQRLDHWNGLQVANQILHALDLSAELFALSIKVKEIIYAERKRQGGMAYLERSLEYFKQTGTKVTESAKSAYMEIDNAHCIWRVKEAAAIALMEYMKRKHNQFEEAHRLCKLAYRNDNPVSGDTRM